jgi:hypothetical protein
VVAGVGSGATPVAAGVPAGADTPGPPVGCHGPSGPWLTTMAMFGSNVPSGRVVHPMPVTPMIGTDWVSTGTPGLFGSKASPTTMLVGLPPRLLKLSVPGAGIYDPGWYGSGTISPEFTSISIACGPLYTCWVVGRTGGAGGSGVLGRVAEPGVNEPIIEPISIPVMPAIIPIRPAPTAVTVL